MAEIVNLRLARKARDRKRAEQQAAENRTKFGRTKAEKTRQQLDDAREASRLDGARRETGDDKGTD
jgi:hypothetical protein